MSAADSEQKLYVLGHPVVHSKSPAMYNAVYRKRGFSWSYGLKDCATEPEARAFLEAGDFLSVNVTMPYKPLALATAESPSASARLAQGANLIVLKDGHPLAFNTDGQGCVNSLERAGVSLAGARVAVCGTGPTALSILHEMGLAGASDLLLLSRSADRARAVLERYVDAYGQLAHATLDLGPAQAGRRSFRQAYDEATYRYGSYATSTRALREADVVVNATPLGMNAGDPAPFDGALLHAGQVAFDVVYGHGETAFDAAARAAGCALYTGGGMLVGQAVATVQTICMVHGIELEAGADELFDLMAEAGGFAA